MPDFSLAYICERRDRRPGCLDAALDDDMRAGADAERNAECRRRAGCQMPPDFLYSFVLTPAAGYVIQALQQT